MKMEKAGKRIGLIARADNSGLGTLSWSFFEHLKPVKTLIVQNGRYRVFTERFPGAKAVDGRHMTPADVDWLLSGIDVLIAIETPYNWEIFQSAKKVGVKTVLIPMYECLPARLPCEPDAYITPSLIDTDTIKSFSAKPVYPLPCPIDRVKLPYRLRKKAQNFVFHNGHGGGGGRNGVDLLFRAMAQVRGDIKMIVYSQVPLQLQSDQRIIIREGNFKNYWDIWREGDIYVWPHRFDGLSLPVQEALAVGMPVLTTDFYPFNKWIPKEWLFGVKESRRTKVFAREIDVYEAGVTMLARKIMEYANKDITKDSKRANEIAQTLSWEVNLPKYLEVINNL